MSEDEKPGRLAFGLFICAYIRGWLRRS